MSDRINHTTRSASEGGAARSGDGFTLYCRLMFGRMLGYIP